jgi:hypothetical protein
MSNNINNNLNENLIKINHKGESKTININKDDYNIKALREDIKSLLNYNKVSQFDLYRGKYHINEVMDDVSVSVLNKSFLSNEYDVIPIPIPIPSISLYQIDYKIKLEDYLAEHKKVVNDYMMIYDVEDDLRHMYEEMDQLSKNLKKMYEEISQEEEYLRVNGYLNLHDKYMKQVEILKKDKDDKTVRLDECLFKMLEYKNMEKIAFEIIRENKKMIAIIHSNSGAIGCKKREINLMVSNRKYILLSIIFRDKFS